jgi:hypothetical protein
LHKTRLSRCMICKLYFKDVNGVVLVFRGIEDELHISVCFCVLCSTLNTCMFKISYRFCSCYIKIKNVHMCSLPLKRAKGCTIHCNWFHSFSWHSICFKWFNYKCVRKLFDSQKIIWAVSWQNQHNGFATSMDPDQPAHPFLYLL